MALSDLRMQRVLTRLSQYNKPQTTTDMFPGDAPVVGAVLKSAERLGYAVSIFVKGRCHWWSITPAGRTAISTAPPCERTTQPVV